MGADEEGTLAQLNAHLRIHCIGGRRPVERHQQHTLGTSGGGGGGTTNPRDHGFAAVCNRPGQVGRQAHCLGVSRAFDRRQASREAAEPGLGGGEARQRRAIADSPRRH